MLTSIYAGLAALIFLYLSIQVIKCRIRNQVVLGDDGKDEMVRYCRAHGNFAEYVPLTLLLIALAEMQGAPQALIHVLGIALLAGRMAHFISLTRREPAAAREGRMDLKLRQFAMMLTFSTLAVSGIAAIILPLFP